MSIDTPAIYEFDERTDGRITGYAAYARLIDGIREVLYNRYGVKYELYASDDPNVEYRDLLQEHSFRKSRAGACCPGV